MNAVVQRSMFTLAAAARELEVSRETLRKWIDAGKVPVIYIGPPDRQLRRISRDVVERLKHAA